MQLSAAISHEVMTGLFSTLNRSLAFSFILGLPELPEYVCRNQFLYIFFTKFLTVERFVTLRTFGVF